jgi:hypothetical protein
MSATTDPGILQASYFQQPGLFSDVMTALFGAASQRPGS